MIIIRRSTMRSSSFVNQRPEAAALAIAAAGLSLLGAMMPTAHVSPIAATERAGTLPFAAEMPAAPAFAAMALPDGPISPQQAFAINAAMPISPIPNPGAAPFVLATDAASHARALDCLTAAVYYEANSEGDAGEAAVAQVVLNRVRSPSYPKSVCAVVFDGTERGPGCQFTFTCDGSLARSSSPAGWQRARRVARAALAGRVVPSIGWSTHYHTAWVAPDWAQSLLKTAVIGAHIFYRASAARLHGRYAGAEPEIARMAAFGDTAAAGTPAPQPLSTAAETAPVPAPKLASQDDKPAAQATPAAAVPTT